MPQEEKPEFVIDSDFGIDDATALLIALKSPSIKVKAITVVDGNVTVSQGVRNCQILLELLSSNHSSKDHDNQDIQIYKGAQGPIIQGLGVKETWPGHGKDGLGNFTESQVYKELIPKSDYSERFSVVESKNAAMAMIDMVNEKPNHYTLIAMGPLTNLAIAVLMDPNHLSKWKHIYLMGGCLFAQGNSLRTTEFNFYCDPEAAHIVFESSLKYAKSMTRSLKKVEEGPLITMITWETTVEHGLSWEFYDHLVLDPPITPFSKFLQSIISIAESMSRRLKHISSSNENSLTEQFDETKSKENNRFQTKNEFEEQQHHHDRYLKNVSGFVMCDIYAIAIAIDPSIILSQKKWDVEIELGGRHTRGLVAMNWFDAHNEFPNVNMVMSMDLTKIMKMMEDTFKT